MVDLTEAFDEEATLEEFAEIRALITGNPAKERKCLKCDGLFLSALNRICSRCKATPEWKDAQIEYAGAGDKRQRKGVFDPNERDF